MRLDDVVEKYDAASKHYDRLMDFVFGKVLNLERHRGRALELIGDVEGKTVIDVGCGTGRNFPTLTRKVGPRGRIIGVDCSAGMLERAERLAHEQGWRNIELMRGDAVKLDGILEPADALVSVWCYGTVYDLNGALNRAIDVLRPGGRIAIMTFVRASPEHGPLRWLYPLSRIAVRCAGIDPANDFDNSALEAKWDRGRALLRARLGDLHEEPYLQGAGLIIAGRRPTSAASAAGVPAAGRAHDDARDGIASQEAELDERPAVP